MKDGFTLAEVLITLAIIGVIAAISVPSLIQKTNQAELITAWKKNYASLSQACAKYNFDNGDISTTLMGNQFANKLTEYTKVIKTCSKTDYIGSCWHNNNEWQSLSGSPRSTGVGYVEAGEILNNGTIMILQDVPAYTCNQTPNYNNNTESCFNFLIDINGFKKPNTIGKDIFGAHLYADGILQPFQSTDTNYACTSTATASPDTNGWNCSTEYLYQK